MNHEGDSRSCLPVTHNHDMRRVLVDRARNHVTRKVVFRIDGITQRTDHDVGTHSFLNRHVAPGIRQVSVVCAGALRNRSHMLFEGLERQQTEGTASSRSGTVLLRVTSSGKERITRESRPGKRLPAAAMIRLSPVRSRTRSRVSIEFSSWVFDLGRSRTRTSGAAGTSEPRPTAPQFGCPLFLRLCAWYNLERSYLLGTYGMPGTQ